MQNKNVKQEKLNGREWLNDYLRILEKSCSDFPDVKFAFEKACLELRGKYEYTDKIIEYTNDMLISSLEFSFELGLNDNLRHFKNPKAPTFLDSDYDDALKETELRTKPDYLEAEANLKKYVDLLPNNLWSLYDVMIEYRAFLEAYIPKMAHYYGFVTGNKVLKKSLKGYEPDYDLTKKYKNWLDVYLDLRLE